MQPQSPTDKSNRLSVIALAVALVGATLYAFWPAVATMADKWQTDPQYSHGYLVPVFALALLYWRRDRLEVAKCRFDWRGLLLIAFGAIAYVAGGFLYLDSLAAGALVPSLLGVALLVGGPASLRWSWPMILFLVFMIPLPYSAETALGQPLRSIATSGSTWLLQLMGYPAVAEKNVIQLEHGRIAVVEACSGLSMLLTFAAMTTAMAMAVKRPLLDRLLLVLSTIPVAVLVNIVRIAANGFAIEEWTDPRYAHTIHEIFHDYGGLLMMPLAILLLFLELWAFGRLFIEVPSRAVMPVIGLPSAPRPASPTTTPPAKPPAQAPVPRTPSAATS